ncbi:MAG: N-acetyltransferase DgcN [Bacteroidota bacterium]
MPIQPPYLLFLGDITDPTAAKTAKGIAEWRPDWAQAQCRLPGCAADLGLPDCTPAEAAAAGVKTLIVGVANSGGILPDHWLDTLEDALDHGLDLASGLHRRLRDIPRLRDKAAALGRTLTDVRYPDVAYPIGNGRKRSGKRALMVGTDCSVGKMFTALAITQAMQEQGHAATFRATGQTGIFIAGDGVPVDAVVSDFISGAVETLAPDNDPDHWDVIEGQGSLFHPSFAAVTLGLIHGAQADALVLCAAPRPHMRHLPNYPVPSFDACIDLYQTTARLTNPRATVVGFSINTSSMAENAARQYLGDLSAQYQLPATDPYRFGAAPLVEALLQR